MQFASITPDRHAEFLEIVNAEIRPDRAKTNAWDDFPLILSPNNAEWTLVATTPEGEIAAGLACLIREYSTSCGKIPLAGIGSVVTKPKFQGQGLSTALQNALLTKLKGKNVPLAVLWTDKPEIYAGRGFAPAGWELHVDLTEATLDKLFPPGFQVREFIPTDTEAVQGLYDRHQLRTLRLPGDAEQLYNMPGTQGLVATGDDDTVLAAVFCGKGADFPNYVAEWSGPIGLVVALLGEARRRQWAENVLIPPGGDQLAAQLINRGAGNFASPGGYWAVLQPDSLSRYMQAAGIGAPAEPGDPAALLGHVDDMGNPVMGPVTISVWGLDSV